MTPVEDTRRYARAFVVWLCSLVTTQVVVIGAGETDPVVVAACTAVVTILFVIVVSAFRSGVWVVAGMTVLVVGVALLR
ncbi:hypothetical protein OG948_60490 (plasmid) [Embleya sp. NBC_00888]|uniref:hypothetical protein n=1 Tax=Embleya sp. NBC_00888 TaxID=2975960 RepID=UPI0038653BBC|nr:hypothetical protein OG948_60490 [Embleya sp. NBC_00888]